MRKYKLLLFAIIFTACSNKIQDENKSEWVSLTDGKTFDNWHTYLSDSVVGWKIEDGAYVLIPGEGPNYFKPNLKQFLK